MKKYGFCLPVYSIPVCMCVCAVASDFCDPMECSPPSSSVHGDSSGPCPPSGDLPEPGTELFVFYIGRKVLYH